MFVSEETRWLDWHCRIWKHFISYPIVHQNLATSLIQNKHALSKIWKPKEKKDLGLYFSDVVKLEG